MYAWSQFSILCRSSQLFISLASFATSHYFSPFNCQFRNLFQLRVVCCFLYWVPTKIRTMGAAGTILSTTYRPQNKQNLKSPKNRITTTAAAKASAKSKQLGKPNKSKLWLAIEPTDGRPYTACSANKYENSLKCVVNCKRSHQRWCPPPFFLSFSTSVSFACATSL